MLSSLMYPYPAKTGFRLLDGLDRKAHAIAQSLVNLRISRVQRRINRIFPPCRGIPGNDGEQGECSGQEQEVRDRFVRSGNEEEISRAKRKHAKFRVSSPLISDGSAHCPDAMRA